MPRRVWAMAVLLVAAGGASPAVAQPLFPPDPPPSPGDYAPLPPPPGPVTRPRDSDILGAPVAVRGEPVRPSNDLPPEPRSGSTLPVGFSEPPAVQQPSRAVGLGAPSSATAVPASAIEPVARNVPAGPAADPVNDFLTRRSSSLRDTADRVTRTTRTTTDKASWKFGEKLEGALGQQSEWFRSDHAFDGFISPVTSPFLFEDPRSLTEVRPVFLYQKIPGGQVDFRGGSISFFGVQGRVAFTDRFSFTINKLGGLWLNSGTGSGIGDHSGFAEFWFGPKYTFIRNEQTGSLLAGGLLFQLATGSSSAFQNTGSFSMAPYVTYAQNFGRDWRVGSMNAMVNTGYSFSSGNSRSDYYYLNGHLDLDIMNKHRFYPLVELNWVLNTTNGNSNPFGVEGRDLLNLGGRAQGKGLLTGAIGGRFKITESAQIGTAFEYPLVGSRDLFQYRFTLDFILRY